MSKNSDSKQNTRAAIETKVSRALVLSGGGGRGAYQAGVWAWLDEQRWRPDLICGSSVGSINGAAIAGGMGADGIRDLWRSIEQHHVFHLSPWGNLVDRVKETIGLSRGVAPAVDTTPLRTLLTQHLDMQAVRESDIELFVSAVRVLDAQVRYFEGTSLTIEHIMASSAIPIVFPWEMIDGEAYWDGGLAVNTPLLPAIQRDAREIVAVVFAPVQGLKRLPATQAEASQWVFEVSTLTSAASLVALLRVLHGEPPVWDLSSSNVITFGSTTIYVVSPQKLLGFRSLLNFHPQQSNLLFDAGYHDAGEQLGPLLSRGGTENQVNPADASPPRN